MKRALITGITGMDGSHMADFLLEKGYKVFGMERRSSTPNRRNTSHLESNENFEFVNGDLSDQNSIFRVLRETKPDEVYNLGSQSFVAESWNTPEQTGDVTGLGALRMLEAIREYGESVKFYQASTSEMFGKVKEIPQSEETPFHPRSPYGVAKVFAHWSTLNYQESYNLFASSGILFNHESPLRGKEFVTRKITDSVAKISLGLLDIIELGNLDAKRDWGYAKDYVEGMYQILQAEKPDVFVLATGRTETVRDFVEMAFKSVNIQLKWEGENENEVGINVESGSVLVKINPKFYRPAEVELLIGDPTKAKNILNWESKTTLEELCEMMVKSDIERNKNGSTF